MENYRPGRGLSLFLLCTMLLPRMVFAVDAPVGVAVSILPQKYFVERVGGKRVSVSVMVGPGRSPATYEPTPRQLAQLGEARLYFSIGVAFENVWMDRIGAASPGMRIVDSRRGIRLRDIDSVGPGNAGDPGGGIKDPHVWTSPMLVKVMAGHIRDALIEADPDHREVYTDNYIEFAEDLYRLDREIREMFRGLTSGSFMVFHPSWGYFADAYGLKQIPIESSGKEPGPRTLASLIDKGRVEQVKVIFVQGQFSRRTADTVAGALGAGVAVVNPLAENYIDNLRDVAQRVAQSLAE